MLIGLVVPAIKAVKQEVSQVRRKARVKGTAWSIETAMVALGG